MVHVKTLIFERPEHLRISSKILANIFSDSLAILKNCQLMPADFFHRKIPSSVPVMMMMIALITFKSSIAPLVEGLCSSNPWKFQCLGFRRNRTDDLGIKSPSL